MFKISKKYPDTPSRNIDNYVKFDTIQECREYLKNTAKFWTDHSGIVESQTDDELTVTEGNGENRIIFKIEEE